MTSNRSAEDLPMIADCIVSAHGGSTLTSELTGSYNSSNNDSLVTQWTNCTEIGLRNDIIDNKIVQAIFCLLYTSIFVLGLFGNILVCYVVGRNRAMHTVTNCFITNLALSDILLCALAVPFTPLYSFLGRWIFGDALCHLVVYAQSTSVYISTLTLTSIAVDRFFVIIYPFKPRMRLSTCLAIIFSIWAFSLIATIPFGLYMVHKPIKGRFFCEEAWPSEKFRQVFGGMTASIQFVVPFIVVTFCYVRVSVKLNDRAKSKPGAKTSRKEEADRERKKRTNRMLIAMVTIFGVSWLPINLMNVINDLYIPTSTWVYYNFFFFLSHAVAMSSTCYNPFLYAWLNDNFRKEFKQVLPCFGPQSGSQASGRLGNWRSERTCNGNETCQETLLPTSVVISTTNKPSPPMLNVNMSNNNGASGGGGGGTDRGARLKSTDSVEVVLVAYTTAEDTVHFDKLDKTPVEPQKNRPVQVV